MTAPSTHPPLSGRLPAVRPGPPRGDARDAALADLLTAPTAPGGQDGLRSVFQPVVDLASGAPVAFEALVRGPRGSGLETPGDLFAAAARTGRTADLDRACQRTALAEAAAHGLSSPWTLFLNTEPEVAGLRRPATAPTGARHAVVVELTERALTSRPAELLHLVDLLRGRGWGIALDDVGADPASLALLALVRPDVIKLDLRLVQQQPDSEVAAIVGAVSAQAERDGSTVLAEGIETPAQLRAAVAMGATLGQGWLFGRPAPLAEHLGGAARPARAVPVARRAPLAGPGTPFALGSARRPSRPAGRELVAEVTRNLELQAVRSQEPCVVVATRRPAGHDAPRGADRDDRLARIAAGAAFVAVLHAAGDHVPAVEGVRHVPLPADDPLLQEDVVAVLGPHFAGAVIARHRAEVEDRDATHDVVVTHSRHLVVDVVARLLDEVGAGSAATPPSPVAPPPTAPALPAAALADVLGEALESDRRTGTGTGLLLVGLDQLPGEALGADADGEDRAPGCPEAVVRRVRSAVRAADAWVPLGDGLHAVVLRGLPRAGAEGVVDRVTGTLLHALECSPLTAPGRGVLVSIGASLTPDRAATTCEAVQQAEAALAAARAAGGHCARIWPV